MQQKNKATDEGLERSLMKYGLVFPGQGSQSVGMLEDVATKFNQILPIFKEASDVLGYDLWRLVQEGPATELDKTTYTQPALLVASYAVYRILADEYSIKPSILAGHSLGEYTALVCAKALSFKDAVKIVATRGALMQAAVPEGEGAMAAIIGLDEKVVREICQTVRQSNEVLAPANYNSIGQTVIAGHKVAVLRAITVAKEKGAKLAVLLPVSVPSHCKLMQKAALKLEELLNSIAINVPEIPIINNVDVVCYDSRESIREGLVRQLYMPVRWVETIEIFIKTGVTRIVECGPGKVLSGLNKRINKTVQTFPTGTLTNIEQFAVVYKQDEDHSHV